MMRDLKDIVVTTYPFNKAGVRVASEPSFAFSTGTKGVQPSKIYTISGGACTELWYFKHIKDICGFDDLEVMPHNFGDESEYTERFPQRINKILKGDPNAKFFCVFDWDTIRGNAKKLAKHEKFKNQYVNNASVTLCPSMPCIEYCFLLHFENYTNLLENYQKVANRLSNFMQGYFPKFSDIKKGKYLQFRDWVQKLCADSKLELATRRAEDNIKKALENNDLDNQSYSFVYLIFKNYNAVI